MKLLVLGGTKFLGRHIVNAVVENGHDVVLFNRGQTNPGLYPELENIIGDRDDGLSVLKGRTFDGVIDTSGYVPRVVQQSADLLSEGCDFYAFISSISVYPDGTTGGYDENAPVQELEDPGSENVQADYGALKVACERAVATRFPDRCLQVRAGLIVGPYDPTGRFTYWVTRVARGGEVLAPAPAEAPVQFIDARDLAEWTVGMVEEGAHGVFNVTGPSEPYCMEDLLDECARTTGSDVHFTWVDPAFLLERGVEPWSDLPLWLPQENGMLQADVSKAKAAGLHLRPVPDTVSDVLAWAEGLDELPGDAGIDPSREAAILEEWRAAS